MGRGRQDHQGDARLHRPSSGKVGSLSRVISYLPRPAPADYDSAFSVLGSPAPPRIGGLSLGFGLLGEVAISVFLSSVIITDLSRSSSCCTSYVVRLSRNILPGRFVSLTILRGRSRIIVNSTLPSGSRSQSGSWFVRSLQHGSFRL